MPFIRAGFDDVFPLIGILMRMPHQLRLPAKNYQSHRDSRLLLLYEYLSPGRERGDISKKVCLIDAFIQLLLSKKIHEALIIATLYLHCRFLWSHIMRLRRIYFFHYRRRLWTRLSQNRVRPAIYTFYSTPLNFTTIASHSPPQRCRHDGHFLVIEMDCQIFFRRARLSGMPWRAFRRFQKGQIELHQKFLLAKHAYLLFVN